MRIKPYNISEADIILSWSKDETDFYKWSAGVLGEYPIRKEKFNFVNNLMAFTAIEDDEHVGFFTIDNVYIIFTCNNYFNLKEK